MQCKRHREQVSHDGVHKKRRKKEQETPEERRRQEKKKERERGKKVCAATKKEVDQCAFEEERLHEDRVNK